MIQPTVDNLTVAANYLARSEQCSRIVNEIDGFIEGWAKSPKLYGGDMAVLNPLIVLGVEYPDRYKALLAKIYEARATVADTARVDYQRDLMRTIRAREANAVALEEFRRGSRMDRRERLLFLQQVKREWQAGKRHAVAVSRLGTREATRAYWEGVDRKLAVELRRAVKNARAVDPALAA